MRKQEQVAIWIRIIATDSTTFLSFTSSRRGHRLSLVTVLMTLGMNFGVPAARLRSPSFFADHHLLAGGWSAADRSNRSLRMRCAKLVSLSARRRGCDDIHRHAALLWQRDRRRGSRISPSAEPALLDQRWHLASAAGHSAGEQHTLAAHLTTRDSHMGRALAFFFLSSPFAAGWARLRGRCRAALYILLSPL